MSGKRKSQTVYRIGEAARALALKTCVLRFWEGEFPQLAPVRTPKGQRLYTERDMLVLRRIRSLLHEQGMTIEGARRVLAGEMTAPAEGAAEPLRVPRCCREQGSLVEDTPRRGDRGAPSAASSTALLTAAVAELKSLRDLLRDRPALPEALASDSFSGASGEDSPPPPSFPVQGPSL